MRRGHNHANGGWNSSRFAIARLPRGSTYSHLYMWKGRWRRPLCGVHHLSQLILCRRTDIMRSRAYLSNLFENGAYPSNFGRGLSEQEVGLMRAIILKMGLISVITRIKKLTRRLLP